MSGDFNDWNASPPRQSREELELRFKQARERELRRRRNDVIFWVVVCVAMFVAFEVVNWITK